MSKTIVFLISLLLLSNGLWAQQQLVWGQDEKYPLYTDLDSSKVAHYIGGQSFGHFHEEDNLAFREYLAPFVKKGDPMAEYLYAQTYDLFPYGLGTPADAEVALKYYKKAAAHNYADAEIMLFGIYRYAFMGVAANPQQAKYHLHRAIEFGDTGNKASMLERMAGAFYASDGETGVNADFPVFTYNTDSTIYYLNEVLKYEPDNTWALDFLGSIYEKKEQYVDAAAIYLQSDNINSKIMVAEWYIRGEKLDKDIDKGLTMLFETGEIVQNMEQQFMGVRHPIHLLNHLYECDGLLTKKQIGKFWMEHFHCP